MQLETIADDDDLHRRLPPGSVIAGVVNSTAFITNRQPDNQISVDLARLTSPQETLKTRPHFGIGSLRAGSARRLGFEVVHDPLPENDAHSLIRGQNSKALCRLLAEQTIVFIAPRAPLPLPE